MIVGVGIDVVEIARFRRVMRRQGERFPRRVFTSAERKYCDSRPDPIPHYAARFAAKEAVLKALGTGWSAGIAWTDVEVVRRERGVEVNLTGEARKRAKKLGARKLRLSITHTDHTAAAVAIASRA